jgi:hypothetical protein
MSSTTPNPTKEKSHKMETKENPSVNRLKEENLNTSTTRKEVSLGKTRATTKEANLLIEIKEVTSSEETVKAEIVKVEIVKEEEEATKATETEASEEDVEASEEAVEAAVEAVVEAAEEDSVEETTVSEAETVTSVTTSSKEDDPSYI